MTYAGITRCAHFLDGLGYDQHGPPHDCERQDVNPLILLDEPYGSVAIFGDGRA